jgi:hypothetical protein
VQAAVAADEVVAVIQPEDPVAVIVWAEVHRAEADRWVAVLQAEDRMILEGRDVCRVAVANEEHLADAEEPFQSFFHLEGVADEE